MAKEEAVLADVITVNIEERQELAATGADLAVAVSGEKFFAGSAAGLLGRHSKATYFLRIKCRELDRVADVLGAITSQKNAKLESIRWQYGEEDMAHERLVDAATRRAHDKARRLAENLGVKLAGVHSYRELWNDTDHRVRSLMPAADPALFRAKRLQTKEDLGLEISHHKRLTLQVQVEYLVRGYGSVD